MAQELPPYFQEKFSFAFFKRTKRLSSAAACIAALAILTIYFQSSPKPEIYVAAEEAVARWKLTRDDVSFQEMNKALKKVPSLAEKYEASIAQKLFETDQISDVLVHAYHSLKRIEKDAPFHAAYGETTLLIEQGAYQDALERSVRLKEHMGRARDWNQIVGDQLLGGSLLYVHNLLRIACLQQKLQNKPGEKAAWDELESFLVQKGAISRLFLSNFREKGLDLTNYIAERRKQL